MGNELVERKFGRWEVIEELVRVDKNGRKRPACVCRCECGNEKMVDLYTLVGKKSTGCITCSNKRNSRSRSLQSAPATRSRFGLLEVVGSHFTKRYLRIECNCSCGKKVTIPYAKLRRASGPRSCYLCKFIVQQYLTPAEVEARAVRNTVDGEVRAKHTEERKELKRAKSRLYNKKPEVVRRVNVWAKSRYVTDPSYRTLVKLRSRLRKSVLAAGRNKAARTEELLGCGPMGLKSHIESLFQPGMTWDNNSEWHIDHIRPCASFDLTDPDQQRQCFHYTNLQPLWWSDNLKKGSLWEGRRHRYRKIGQPLNRSIDGSMLGLSTGDLDEVGVALGEKGLGQDDPGPAPDSTLPGPDPARPVPAG